MQVIIIIFFLLFCNHSFSDEINKQDSSEASISFLQVNGTHFTNRSNPDFKFMGVNLDPWRFIISSGEIYKRSDFDSLIKNAREYCGAKVIRMHINGGSFEPSAGNYDENAFKQLDSLLAAAEDNNFYVIVALRDYLWSPWPKNAYDSYWYLGGGTKARPNKDAILTDSKAKMYFKNFIAYVLNRKNSINGKIYKDDPVIMSWEIINEPKIIPGQFKGWLEEMGNFIRSMDSNHLLCLGIGGTEESYYDPGSANWRELNVPILDFLDLHYYAPSRNYNPVNKSNLTKIRNRALSALSLKKPVIFGEFGTANTDSDFTIKNLYVNIISNAFDAGASGTIPYSWGPPGPNGWGGKYGGFSIYTDYTELCTIIKSLAP